MLDKNSYDKKQIRVVNIGIQMFYEALVSQQVDCVQIQWQPPVKQSKEIEDLIDSYL